MSEFAFLTNHGKTLLLIAQDRRIRMRDIAHRLEITERATQRIVADLAKAGYIDREREGRRNRYSVRADVPLGLPIQRDVDIGSLLGVLVAQDDSV
jgi:DNA-binding Lrp family transcriptional regulator